MVIGGGLAGLSASLELAHHNIDVDLVEKQSFLGGYAANLKCKTTGRCVKCNACMVETKLRGVIKSPRINVLRSCNVNNIKKGARFEAHIRKSPDYLDPDMCSRCGLCIKECPEDGAILKGASTNDYLYYAVNEQKCLYVKNRSCTLCQEVCIEGAIKLEDKEVNLTRRIDAIIIATGFSPSIPNDKQYGYGVCENVVTSLEAEKMLRQKAIVVRPSDGKVPDKVAFIQCACRLAGDSKNQDCFRVCCGSTLHMLNFLKSKQPEMETILFFPDRQVYGEDFPNLLELMQQDTHQVKAKLEEVAGDGDGGLALSYHNNDMNSPVKERFDMVVLSVGITPGKETKRFAKMLDINIADSGFVAHSDQNGFSYQDGVFTTGTIRGPMNISETASDACVTAREVAKYLE